MKRLRPGFRWALITSAVLSGLLILWPQDFTAPLVASAADDPTRASNLGVNIPFAEGEPGQVLPETLPRPQLAAARFDPFAGFKPPAPAVPPAAHQPIVPPPLLAPPQAPVVNYRYLGRMTDPAGQSYVYLAKGDAATAVTVRSGDRLEDGYVVESIEQHGVRLHYPALDVRAVIPFPADSEPVRR